ncbi:MAG: hypothetical protein VKL39_15105, partial [Leptolyngbyaceae bacterium]|nr:hypothetical protein [Leptolyngbyaceae bacterium]
MSCPFGHAGFADLDRRPRCPHPRGAGKRPSRAQRRTRQDAPTTQLRPRRPSASRSAAPDQATAAK